MVNVGIASVSMNREDNLIQCLPTWLDSGAETIHILDWNSNIDLEQLIRSKFGSLENAKFLRVDNNKPWILTHAFNIVLSSLKTDFIAKFDSDHKCKNKIFEELKLEKGNFYRFNFLDNMPGTNGAFISCKDILEKANFFDERIVTYGWDESDLFERIQNFTNSIKFLDPSYISHLPHTKQKRIESQNISIESRLSKFLNIDESEFSTKCNFFRVSLSNKWNINSNSGFVLANNNLKNIELNKFSQKEFFDRRVLNLAFLLTIQYFQINNLNSKVSNLSPKEVLNKEVSNYLINKLKEHPSDQWALMDILKFIEKNNFEYISKENLKSLLKKLFIDSAYNKSLKIKREEYIDLLLNYLKNN